MTTQFCHLSDQQWLDLLIRSVETPQIDGFDFPLFPTAEIQVTFVGSAFEHSLREAFAFWQYVKEYARQVDRPVQRDWQILDFGCGWGRYLRFFWKDVGDAGLHGVDVNPVILRECARCRVPGKLQLIDPEGRLPYPDRSLDLVFAYSVFTHLPEPIQALWLGEIARVLKPGGLFVGTIEKRRFLQQLMDPAHQPDSAWLKLVRSAAGDLSTRLSEFDKGNFVFIKSNGLEHYGDAVIPKAYVDRVWSKYLDVDRYDERDDFYQGIVSARAPGGPPPPVPVT